MTRSLEVGGGGLPEESQEEEVVGRALHTHCLSVQGLQQRQPLGVGGGEVNRGTGEERRLRSGVP